MDKLRYICLNSITWILKTKTNNWEVCGISILQYYEDWDFFFILHISRIKRTFKNALQILTECSMD